MDPATAIGRAWDLAMHLEDARQDSVLERIASPVPGHERGMHRMATGQGSISLLVTSGPSSRKPVTHAGPHACSMSMQPCALQPNDLTCPLIRTGPSPGPDHQYGETVCPAVIRRVSCW
jgi:hypothetical protein